MISQVRFIHYACLRKCVHTIKNKKQSTLVPTIYDNKDNDDDDDDDNDSNNDNDDNDNNNSNNNNHHHHYLELDIFRRLSEPWFYLLKYQFPWTLIFDYVKPTCEFWLSKGQIRLNLTRGQQLMSMPDHRYCAQVLILWVNKSIEPTSTWYNITTTKHSTCRFLAIISLMSPNFEVVFVWRHYISCIVETMSSQL